MTKNANVLVVEDNDFVRMQLVQFLADEGYEIIEGKNGQEAIDRVSEATDVAIVDVRMEPIDGFEFIRAIRGRGLQTAVILVTGDQNPDLLAESAKWNVGAVLMKPVQRDRLTKTVERVLQIRARQG